MKLLGLVLLVAAAGCADASATWDPPPLGTVHVTFETVSGDCGDIEERDVDLTADEPWLSPPYSVCKDSVTIDGCIATNAQTCETFTFDGAISIDSTWVYDLSADGLEGDWVARLSTANASTTCAYRFHGAY